MTLAIRLFIDLQGLLARVKKEGDFFARNEKHGVDYKNRIVDDHGGVPKSNECAQRL